MVGTRRPRSPPVRRSGVWCDEVELERLFRLRSERVFDRAGYLLFRRWRVYGERGLAGQRGAVWLSGEVLTVAYAEEALAQYAVAYAAETRRIVALTDVRLFATRHPLPQPFLPGLGEVDWLPA
jgi:hypothetical protein